MAKWIHICFSRTERGFCVLALTNSFTSPKLYCCRKEQEEEEKIPHWKPHRGLLPIRAFCATDIEHSGQKLAISSHHLKHSQGVCVCHDELLHFQIYHYTTARAWMCEWTPLKSICSRQREEISNCGVISDTCKPLPHVGVVKEHACVITKGAFTYKMTAERTQKIAIDHGEIAFYQWYVSWGNQGILY